MDEELIRPGTILDYTKVDQLGDMHSKNILSCFPNKEYAYILIASIEGKSQSSKGLINAVAFMGKNFNGHYGYFRIPERNSSILVEGKYYFPYMGEHLWHVDIDTKNTDIKVVPKTEFYLLPAFVTDNLCLEVILPLVSIKKRNFISTLENWE
jgi:hypothetical protein